MRINSPPSPNAESKTTITQIKKQDVEDNKSSRKI